MKLILMIIVASLIFQIGAEQEQCYAGSKSSYSHFATLTSYFYSRRSEIITPKNCSTNYIWAIIRHGTRYPEDYTISRLVESLPKIRDKIIANHKKGRGSLCKKDLDNLQKWNINLTQDMALELTQQGKKEQMFLAQNVKHAFPKYFESPSKDIFMFQSSDIHRAQESAIAFSNELLKTNFSTPQGHNITQDGEFLQLKKHCPSYLKHLTFAWEEIKSFRTSALWQKIAAEISLRLGFLQPLPYDDIKSMYDICAYEKAWNPDTKPPFCAVFTTEDLKAMEYHIDMQQYYKKGYGSQHLNEQLGCPIVQDMMLSLTKAAKNVEKIRGKFLFSHSETMVPVMVKLGLFKEEEPLKLENYDKLIEKRKWRTALFDSFAANLIVALHSCPSQNGSQMVVSFHQNEYPVVIPQCESDPCILEELENIFQDVFDEKHCNTDFCKLPQASKSNSLFYNSNLILLLFGFSFIKYNYFN